MASLQRAPRDLGTFLRRMGPRVVRVWVLGPVIGFWALALLVEAGAYPGGAPFLPRGLLAVLDTAILGGILLLLWNLAARYVRALYGANSLSQARSFLLRSVLGMPRFQPHVTLREGKAIHPAESVLLQAGGPANLIVRPDTAALLERAGRFVRVVGPGDASPPPQRAGRFGQQADRQPRRLQAWERVYATFDLRPQQRSHDVQALSKEGIPVSCRADITFELDTGDGITAALDPDAVFDAATCAWVREAERPLDSRVMSWADRLQISDTEAALRSILARYSLDQLIGLPSMDSDVPQPAPSAGPQGQHVQEAIRAELETALRQSAGRLRARVLQVSLGQIEVPVTASQECIKNATVENWARRHRAEAEAEAARILETGMAEVMTAYLTRVGQMLATLPHPESVSSPVVLAKMVEALEGVANDPLTLSYLPQHTLVTLQQLEETIASVFGPDDSGETPSAPQPEAPPPDPPTS